MSFEPLSENHAIVEVVFGITFSKPFGTPELEKFAETHDSWKADLPKMSRSSALKIVLGGDGFQGGELRFPSAGGVLFERMKPDGNLDWRVRVDENFVHVNCLSYTSWADVWGRAKPYLLNASNLVAPTTPIANVFLQYIDVFEWRGEREAYRLDELLRPDSPLVPDSLMDKGPLWHCHQGWFRKDNLPFNSKILERIHADGIEGPKKNLLVKVDSYLQLDFGEIMPPAEFFDKKCEMAFDLLHSQNKLLLSGMLKEDMAKRIGLDVRA